MSSGLYNTHKIDFDTTLDLTRLKPYGDTMNDADQLHPAHQGR